MSVTSVDLEEGIEEEVISSPGSSFASEDSEEADSKIDLHSIFEARQDAEAAISRLNRISASIRRSGLSQKDDRASNFVLAGPHGEDLVHQHEVHINAVLQRELKGHVSYEFRERTMQLIMLRWRRILYRRAHQRKLAVEPDESRKRTTISQPDLQTSVTSDKEPPTVKKQTLEARKMVESANLSQTHTIDLERRTIQEEAPSVPVPSTLTRSSVNAPIVEIPDPPSTSTDVFECPYCCVLSPAKDVSTARRWK